MSDLCSEPRICEVGGSGVTSLPWGGDAEQKWPAGIRAVLYTIALAWFFLGVALIADVFMGAIEHITSKKVRKWKPECKRYITVDVWNPTVANLTLMALGSSAPEIMLSVIELLGKDFYSGDLGPSTIVGSAAFNLFVIIAVCIMAIPDNEVRSIKEMPVYITTAAFSLFAYVWLLVILQGPWSKNVVEFWEGLLTLAFMPVLVILAFMADKGYFAPKKEGEDEGSLQQVGAHANMSVEELAQVEARIRRTYGEHLTETQVAKIIAVEHLQTHSRAHYRVAAIRNLTGGKRVKTAQRANSVTATLFAAARRVGSMGPGMAARSMSLGGKKSRKSDAAKVNPGSEEEPENQPQMIMHLKKEGEPLATTTSTVEFAAMRYAVLENAGSREVVVSRKGFLDKIARVSYVTREGTAKPGEDYVHTEGVLTFEPNVAEMKICVSIVDDNAYENDEEFYVDLKDPVCDDASHSVTLGEKTTATVVIIDDDLPGQIAFPEDLVNIKDAVKDQVVELTVARSHGCTGAVTCKYHSEDDSAQAGIDYEPIEGTLTFATGQVSTSISITIKGSGHYERKEMFRVVLTDIEGGATFDAKTDGGADSCILSVFIESSGAESKARIDRIMRKLTRKLEKSKIGHSNWKDQFLDALYVNGQNPNPEDSSEETEHSPSHTFDTSNTEEQEQPSIADYIMHVITVPWKLLFAFVPPTDYCGGWLCFGCSLLMIALVTAVIGDMAGLLGCVLGIPDEITAITFVALGTSLPDTFASKTAAVQDPTADASVGNVTGSNSVNVFLGLGLPWTMGSIYWWAKGSDKQWIGKYGPNSPIEIDLQKFGDGAFVVRSGSLVASVAIFTVCAISAMVMLYARRSAVGGELGGPKHNKMASAFFLVMLWVIYVILSSWYALEERLCK